MLVLFTLGLGMLIGAQVAGAVEVVFTTGTGDAAVVNWKALWAGPAVAAGVIMVLFALLFRDTPKEPNIEEVDVARAAALEPSP